MKKLIYSLSIIAATSSLVFTSCSRDFTETQFFQEELAAEITTVEQLESFVNGTYVKMRSSSYLGSQYRGYAQVHTDETYCTQFSGRNVRWATYTFTSSDGDVEGTWYAIYQVVGNANIVINASNNLSLGGQSGTTAITNRIKNLKGQAYAARALAFFDLLKLYGQGYSGGNLGVVLPTQYKPETLMPRASIAETKAQIESDFENALKNIAVGANASRTKIEFDIHAVKALMSRYYLYTGDYMKAAQYADQVIASNNYEVISSGDFVSSFAKEKTKNSIFELALGLNGALGTTSYDYLMNLNGYANIAVLPSVVSMYENSDVRKNVLEQDGEYYISGKFSDLKGTTNIKLIRYEEVLLNAAEAHLNLGNTAKALNYYNELITNRGLNAVTLVDLDTIKKERTKELLGEGFRFWDLLRWGEVIPYYDNIGVRDASKDKMIGDNLLAFPIPLRETNTPGSLIISNPGYDN
ncbi:RagB/SusD family nutrient uptake outer membrane protein [Bergeyella zoohelcum]|uniref:RagB/SusD domain-containing protein n=1 Tax=Bergeyella zoohelcum ATCC 43767 TaxID=883096 RepID=K1LRE0_9FLAO|nr:RagB/SusD family nutrient uptake outer membrane protein [Bergeyella zoohelcum]EKB59550.1 hypothetical protein HMPREF9699_00119 [Bergeyella zoohelcum ATCC 43767]SUV49706.1 SusD family [Bergeyella zoohelcum]